MDNWNIIPVLLLDPLERLVIQRNRNQPYGDEPHEGGCWIQAESPQLLHPPMPQPKQVLELVVQEDGVSERMYKPTTSV